MLNGFIGLVALLGAGGLWLLAAGVTLNLWSYFTMTDNRGIDRSGRHGAVADASSTAKQLTASTTPAIVGTCHSVSGQLATATVVTAYDDDDDVPADWDYLHYVADQDSYIQIIGPAMSVVFKVAANVPFVIPGFDSLTAAANATPITGGSEPTPSDIDSIVIGNYSGTTMNWALSIID